MRRQIKAKPAGVQPCGVTSATARRILQSLERMSSPLAVSTHTHTHTPLSLFYSKVEVPFRWDQNRHLRNDFFFSLPLSQDARRIPAAGSSPLSAVRALNSLACGEKTHTSTVLASIVVSTDPNLCSFFFFFFFFSSRSTTPVEMFRTHKPKRNGSVQLQFCVFCLSLHDPALSVAFVTRHNALLMRSEVVMQSQPHLCWFIFLSALRRSVLHGG